MKVFLARLISRILWIRWVFLVQGQKQSKTDEEKQKAAVINLP